MIRVTVELIPGGFEDHPRRRVLGTMEIANVHTSPNRLRADYRVRRYGKDGRPGARGEVHNHGRVAESIWELVRKAIEASKVRR